MNPLFYWVLCICVIVTTAVVIWYEAPFGPHKNKQPTVHDASSQPRELSGSDTEPQSEQDTTLPEDNVLADDDVNTQNGIFSFSDFFDFLDNPAIEQLPGSDNEHDQIYNYDDVNQPVASAESHDKEHQAVESENGKDSIYNRIRGTTSRIVQPINRYYRSWRSSNGYPAPGRNQEKDDDSDIFFDAEEDDDEYDDVEGPPNFVYPTSANENQGSQIEETRPKPVSANEVTDKDVGVDSTKRSVDISRHSTESLSDSSTSKPHGSDERSVVHANIADISEWMFC
jgi:hypothetical protein